MLSVTLPESPSGGQACLHQDVISSAQSCPTLCDPLDCSMPGFPVHHQLTELTQTWVHQVSDTIQPSHPLSSPLLPCTGVPHPDPPTHLSPHPIPLGHPSAPALSTLSLASNLDWGFISHMIIYMFQCHSPKSSHPLLFNILSR